MDESPIFRAVKLPMRAELQEKLTLLATDLSSFVQPGKRPFSFKLFRTTAADFASAFTSLMSKCSGPILVRLRYIVRSGKSRVTRCLDKKRIPMPLYSDSRVFHDSPLANQTSG